MSRRKNRGVILLASALSLGVIGGLVSCGEQPVEVDPTWKDFVEDDSITGLSVTNVADLQATWKAGEADRTMSITVTPEANITKLINEKKIMAVSSDSTVVNVLGNKLQALKGGEATITVRAGKQKVEFKITVTAVKQYTPGDSETLANIIDLPASSSMYYKTEGVILSWSSGSDGGTYGNFYVATEWNKEATNILVYGATAQDTASVISENSGTYTFTNPKDWNSNTATKDLKIGDKISFYCMRTDHNSTKELYAWGVTYVEHQDFPATPEPASVAVTSLATVLEPEVGSAATVKYTGKALLKSVTYTKYGNLVLTDLDGSNEVTSYGSSATASAITWDGVTEKYTYKNPQDFLTNDVTKDLVVGEEVTFEMIRADYNGSVQVFTVITGATPVAPTAIAVSGETTVTKGETVQLSYTTTPTKVSPSTLAGLTWSSSNTDVATVDSTGLVTGVAAGTATITVKVSDTVSATYDVTVKEVIAPTSITISGTTTTVEAEQTITLTATTTPEVINVPLTWESNDTTVATVDENGVVTGVAAGTAKITAKYGTVVSNEVEVTVTAPVIVAKYDFSTNTSTESFTDGDGASVKTYFTSCLVSGGTDVISEFTEVAKAYKGYSGKTNFGLKFGTSKAAGKLTFKLNDSTITGMKIKGIGWTTSDKISVGSVSYNSSLAYGSATVETLDNYSFTISSTETVTINLTNRFFINSITFIK